MVPESRYLFVLFIPLTLLVLVTQLIVAVAYGDTLVIFTLAFACLVGILFSFKKLTERITHQCQKDLLAQQFTAQEIYIKEASQHYERIRSFGHDLNNHLFVLQAFIEQQRSAKATAYLQHLERAANGLIYHSKTGNIALDALFAYKLIVAKQSGI